MVDFTNGLFAKGDPPISIDGNNYNFLSSTHSFDAQKKLRNRRIASGIKGGAAGLLAAGILAHLYRKNNDEELGTKEKILLGGAGALAGAAVPTLISLLSKNKNNIQQEYLRKAEQLAEANIYNYLTKPIRDPYLAYKLDMSPKIGAPTAALLAAGGGLLTGTPTGAIAGLGLGLGGNMLMNVLNRKGTMPMVATASEKDTLNYIKNRFGKEVYQRAKNEGIEELLKNKETKSFAEKLINDVYGGKI